MHTAAIPTENPTKLVFGTVVRNAPVLEGGELVLVDWDRKSVVRSVPIYPDNPRMDDDPNPRGNTRGCKGIAVTSDRIIAANFHTLQMFDHELNHLSDFSHGLMVGTHEMHCTDGRHLWLSSTVIDAALEYDLQERVLTRSYFPREMLEFQQAMDLEPAGIDVTADNRRNFLTGDHLKCPSHLHLNAVTVHNGDVFVLCHAHGAVCNLSAGEVVIRNCNLRKSHNLLFLTENLLVINDTYRRFIRIYDLNTGDEINAIDLTAFPWVRDLLRRAIRKNLPRKLMNRLHIKRESISRPLFVRGLARQGNKLFIGVSPAAIICVDWQTGAFVDAFQYADDPAVCVHGLALL